MTARGWGREGAGGAGERCQGGRSAESGRRALAAWGWGGAGGGLRGVMEPSQHRTLGMVTQLFKFTANH